MTTPVLMPSAEGRLMGILAVSCAGTPCVEQIQPDQRRGNRTRHLSVRPLPVCPAESGSFVPGNAQVSILAYACILPVHLSTHALT